jgi:hypothetical protein
VKPLLALGLWLLAKANSQTPRAKDKVKSQEAKAAEQRTEKELEEHSG